MAARTTVIGIVVAALAVGCGDGAASEDAGAGGADGGTLDAGDGGEPSALQWEDCYEYAQCATLTVPLDPADASLGTIDLRVLRREARMQPAAATVVVLWGGPGIPGVLYTANQALFFEIAAPEIDIVSIDVRGGDETSPRIECGDDAAWDAIVELDTSPDTDAERAALHDAISAWVVACEANTPRALLERASSAEAVHDLEALRVALGEEQLNILAFDHSSTLVARYAMAYPDRLRAVVLAAPGSPYVDREQHFRLEMAAHEAALERFFAWCAASATCSFHGGERVEDLRAAFVSVRERLEAASTGRRGDLGISFTLQQGKWTELADALTAAESDNFGPLLAAYDPIVSRADGSYTNVSGARMAIRELDRPWPAGFTRADFDAIVARAAAEDAPLTASIVASFEWAAGEWNIQPTRAPAPIGRTTAPPFLIVTSDSAAMPEAGARALADALGNGSLVVKCNHEGHNVILTPAQDLAIDFLVDPARALDPTACQ